MSWFAPWAHRREDAALCSWEPADFPGLWLSATLHIFVSETFPAPSTVIHLSQSAGLTCFLFFCSEHLPAGAVLLCPGPRQWYQSAAIPLLLFQSSAAHKYVRKGIASRGQSSFISVSWRGCSARTSNPGHRRMAGLPRSWASVPRCDASPALLLIELPQVSQRAASEAAVSSEAIMGN